MHLIAAPTRIRAAAYASGLALADSSWAHTSGDLPVGKKAHTVHILPFVEDNAANALVSVAAAHQLKVYDHRP